MTLRKASTLIHFAASFVAAAMLSAANPAAALPALSVTASAAQPMAVAGSDATANQGVALPSMLREDKPVYTAVDLAKAVSSCTKLAALCEKPAATIGALHKIRKCMTCKTTCSFAFDVADVRERPTHELRHWRVKTYSCTLTLKTLLNGFRESVRDGMLTT